MNVKTRNQILLDAQISVMADWAFKPSATASAYLYLFEKPVQRITKEDVAERFGDEAAEAWQAIRDAKAKFRQLAEKHG